MKSIKPVLLLITAFTFLALYTTEAEVFQFRYAAGSKFRAVAQVDETVIQRYGAQQAVQQSALRYKIAYTVAKVDGDSGYLEGVFQIANRSSGDAGVYQWTEDHPTAYWRGPQGRMNVSDQYSFPVVRNVPFFPKRDVKPGETWVGEGKEVHDFRNSGSGFGVVTFPINVAYRYIGPEEYKGNAVDHITADYQVYHRFPASRTVAPEQISGYSSQHLYFDNQHGYLRAYTEEFELVMQLNDGTSWTFRGTASAEVVQAEEMQKEAVADDIRRKLSNDGVADSDVRVDKDGVTISLHNIQFLPDSSRFVPGEKEKIRTIAEILKKYPGRDVLVTGHTAMAGTAAGREQLSLERARVVAQELISLGARDESEVVIRGMGARDPVASNATEAGRRLNRRVEITLLEN